MTKNKTVQQISLYVAPSPTELSLTTALGAALTLREALEAEPLSLLHVGQAMKRLALACEPMLHDRGSLIALAFLSAWVSILLDPVRASEGRSRSQETRNAVHCLQRLIEQLRTLDDRQHKWRH